MGSALNTWLTIISILTSSFTTSTRFLGKLMCSCVEAIGKHLAKFDWRLSADIRKGKVLHPSFTVLFEFVEKLSLIFCPSFRRRLRDFAPHLGFLLGGETFLSNSVSGSFFTGILCESRYRICTPLRTNNTRRGPNTCLPAYAVESKTRDWIRVA